MNSLELYTLEGQDIAAKILSVGNRAVSVTDFVAAWPPHEDVMPEAIAYICLGVLGQHGPRFSTATQMLAEDLACKLYS